MTSTTVNRAITLISKVERQRMKMMFVGDPHLKISRFDLACQFLDWVTKLALQHRPDLVVNLGDTFDNHAVLRSEVMEEFKKHVQNITSSGITYYYVLGNHDMYKPTDSKYHALQPFKSGYDGLVIVDTPIELDDVTFVPFIPDARNFPKQTKRICVAHQTFVGADYGFTRPEEGVDAETVSAEVIISGHIHMRQMFGKVIYPGTPYPQSVNDINQSKGVMFFDTETYNYSFIECPLPAWKGLAYEIGEKFSVQEMHEDIKAMVNVKDHWIVEATGPRAELVAYQNSKQYLELISEFSVKFKPHFSDKEKKKMTIKALSVDNIISEYIDKVYNGSIDREILKKAAIELQSKANQNGCKSKM